MNTGINENEKIGQINLEEETSPDSYRDFFIRGERVLKPEKLQLYRTTIPTRGNSSEDTRLKNLYRDCFSIHVTDYFEGSTRNLELSNQQDRIIAADDITNRFLKNYYKPPQIRHLLETNQNFSNAENSNYSIETFLGRISANPIKNCSADSFYLGTNKISYLIGDVGMGKSTLIARLQLETSKPITDDDGYQIVPIVYDFENRHRDGEKLRPIADEFWADFYTHIYNTISSKKSLKKISDIDSISINPKSSENAFHPFLVSNIRLLIHHLATKKIRLLIIFDNLDRYHFRYTEYSFFDDYSENQMINVRDNISTLIKTFDRADLWKSGVCVLFVCRRYLYDYIVRFGDVVPKDNNFDLYEISKSSVGDVVKSRFDIYSEAISSSRARIATETISQIDEQLRHLRDLMTVKDVGSRIHGNAALDAISKIGHNGHRSLVRFLSSLSLKHGDSDALRRLIKEQPRLLILLYICNNQHRFTQEQDHFPNIFLNDCTIGAKKEFELAHKPHQHSYWLKYLILKYISVQEINEEHATPQEVVEVFSGKNGYEPHFVRYMLGSLCTTAEFSCIHIEYSDGSDSQDCRIYLTERGKYLVSHDNRIFGESSSVDFCFNFLYLQLAIDDKLLAIPRSKFKKIFVDSDYEYLYSKDSEYNPIAPRFVFKKIEASINFLHVLHSFYIHEMRSNSLVFKRLKKAGVSVDFNEIKKHLMQTARNLAVAMHRMDEYAKIEEAASVLDQETSLDKILMNMPQEVLEVRRA